MPYSWSKQINTGVYIEPVEFLELQNVVNYINTTHCPTHNAVDTQDSVDSYKSGVDGHNSYYSSHDSVDSQNSVYSYKNYCSYVP